jgi:hypothetical protein
MVINNNLDTIERSYCKEAATQESEAEVLARSILASVRTRIA